MIKLQTFFFQGTPEQIGHAHGEELRDSIQRFVQVRLDAAVKYFKGEGIVSNDIITGLLDTGHACYEIFQQWDPEGAVEHNAIARAAGVDPVDLYTTTNYTDVRDAYMLAGNSPDAEGCTALMIPPEQTTNNTLLAGQTWDMNPEDIDYVVAVNSQPDNGTERWSIQLSGCLSLMGMNSHGLTLGTTNLKTWGSKPGIGYLNIIHRALRSNTLEAAVTMIQSAAPVAGAHTYLLAAPEAAARIEVTGFNQATQYLSDQAMGWTNHCLTPAHQAQQYGSPSSSSLARIKRLNTLFETTGPFDIDGIKTLFSDHVDGADSINRYPEDKSYAATNACMIADPLNRSLYACRGSADRGEWITLNFNT